MSPNKNSWLEDGYQLSLDLARPLANIALLEDSIVLGLKLVLATLPVEALQTQKKTVIEQWIVYSRMSYLRAAQQEVNHQITSGLITGWWDFIVYAHQFSSPIVNSFQQIFGDFTGAMLDSPTNFQHMLATIERLSTYSINRFPEKMVYSVFRLHFVKRLMAECLIRPHLEQNRQQGMAQVLKNVVSLDEKQVVHLLKYMLLSPYFKDYFQGNLATELKKYQQPWYIDSNEFKMLIEKTTLPKKTKSSLPISVEKDDPVFLYPQAMVLLIVLVLVFRNYKSFHILNNQEGWQSWILNLFAQLHQKDRHSLLGQCLAELVIVSDVQQYIPERKRAEFRACLQIKQHEQIKSIDEILSELALYDRDNSSAATNTGAKKSPKKRGKTRAIAASSSTDAASSLVPLQDLKKFPVQNPICKPKARLQKSPIIEEKESVMEVEEVFISDKLEKSLHKSLHAILRFIQNTPSSAIPLSPTFQQIISATETALCCVESVFQWEPWTVEQESKSAPIESPKSYAIQWNRLLSQCSIDLLKYSEREDKDDNAAKMACCIKTLGLVNASYFRDPSLYLTEEIYTWLQSIAGSKALDGWNSYLTGGVCLDENFLDIDLMFVRDASYISTEQIDREVWPKIRYQFSQIQSEKMFDDANCVQYQVKIRLQDGSDLKMDVTIYTRVTSEAQVIENTSSSLVSTAAVRWCVDGRMLMLPTTALALYAKKPVVKMLGSSESLLEEIQTKRNKIGYLCKQIFKYEHYRLDPMLNQVLLDASKLLLSSDHRERMRPRFEEACAYILDEKRFTRPQAAMRFILTRYNLLAMLYTSSHLDAAFHQACITGFNLYFGVFLANDQDNFQFDVTPTEFLAMYFYSGLMLHPIDQHKFYADLMRWSMLGAVNTRYLTPILSYLPLDIYQCFWQQQSTQTFLYPPIKENPVVSATRILRYWRFPSSPMQETTLERLFGRLSPGSDSQSSSDDSAIDARQPQAAVKRERYGRFHQPKSGSKPVAGMQPKNMDREQDPSRPSAAKLAL